MALPVFLDDIKKYSYYVGNSMWYNMLGNCSGYKQSYIFHASVENDMKLCNMNDTPENKFLSGHLYYSNGSVSG